MEEKNQDKYQELIEGEKEPTVLEEKPRLEKEISVPKEEKVLESEEKLTEEKREVVEEKKIGAEPTKEMEVPEPKVEEPVKEAEPAKEEPEIEKTEEVIEQAAPASTPPSAKAQKQVKQLKDLDRPSQVKALCDLAFQKGLAFAIEVAKTLDNAYVLDEFHDTLVNELYNELVEKGKLKQM